jgi:protein farnesyltransferase subunit beta
MSGQPDAEAHGAYAFCGLGCLSILGAPDETIPQCVAPLHPRRAAPAIVQ